jgi:hypothetical protein
VILACTWTFLAFIGLLGSARNVRRRTLNIRAIETLGINGPTLLTAKTFRASELFRMAQTVIGFSIGVIAMLFYSSHYYRLVSNLPSQQQPTILLIYRYAIQWGFFAWNLFLVLNIWYFGLIGDRVERLRHKEEADGESTHI